ncbi:MAG: hypothetical protein F6K53_20205 [Moorea sp. SIO4A1]|uniref:hypothetical protein n=1 Tax=Moorena sp. SIO4A1 TaxID=2607835 RepID=UPI00144D34ED|nr:hypothetical protein [Moorena sp. SIO4A1]NEQ59595.1 hypothetical protein [Moorena sp. SIO4A1]
MKLGNKGKVILYFDVIMPLGDKTQFTHETQIDIDLIPKVWEKVKGQSKFFINNKMVGKLMKQHCQYIDWNGQVAKLVTGDEPGWKFNSKGAGHNAFVCKNYGVFDEIYVYLEYQFNFVTSWTALVDIQEVQ